MKVCKFSHYRNRFNLNATWLAMCATVANPNLNMKVPSATVVKDAGQSRILYFEQFLPATPA